VIRAFAAWLARVPEATIVANLDDGGVVELVGGLQASGLHHGPLVGVSLAGGAGPASLDNPTSLGLDARVSGTIVERSPDETVVDIEGLGESRWRSRLQVPGDHNASNALVALATAAAAGGAGQPIGPDVAAWALSTFPGIGRRLERKGNEKGVVVYDDYGHHPTAIRATIAALRQREPARRIWAVYEPLTFHRTAAMLPAFADALADADAVAIANIWASRDLDLDVTSPEALARAVRARRPGLLAVAPGSVEDTAAWLAEHVADGDAVLVMGGGRSYRIAELLLESLGSNP
jgi:UDP-N-acetylmuramate--alanine ligase